MMLDRIKIAVSVLLLLAGLTAFYLLSGQPEWVRFGLVLVGVAAAVATAWTSAQGRELRGFTRESIDEARKVAWPSRKESLQTTAAVFGFVVLMAAFLWLTDKSLEWGIYDVMLGWRR